MEILLNGEEREVNSGHTVTQLVESVGIPTEGVAVAINSAVVPRSQWDATALSEGVEVEIVTAVQGG